MLMLEIKYASISLISLKEHLEIFCNIMFNSKTIVLKVAVSRE